MVNIECQNRAIKISRVRRLLDWPGEWREFVLDIIRPCSHVRMQRNIQ